MRKLLFAATCVLAVIGLASCGWADDYNNERGKGDAGVESRDDSDKEVINFPNEFSNVAHGCDGHGHRVYVTTQNEKGKFMAVISDPTCPGGRAG